MASVIDRDPLAAPSLVLAENCERVCRRLDRFLREPGTIPSEETVAACRAELAACGFALAQLLGRPAVLARRHAS
jgi:hypothetical protein